MTTDKSKTKNQLNKLYPVLIMFVLKYCSDESHPMNPPLIVEYLASITSITPDVKTITRCLDTLYSLYSLDSIPEESKQNLSQIYQMSFGGRLCKSDKKLNSYYFVPLTTKATFTSLDSIVISNKRISEDEKIYLNRLLQYLLPERCTKTEELLASIQCSQEIHQMEATINNLTLMQNIDTLYRAIISKNKVTITATTYVRDRSPKGTIKTALLPPLETLNPHALFWHKGIYYLLATDENNTKPLHIRVDHIAKVKNTQIEKDALPEFLVTYFDKNTGEFLSETYTTSAPYLFENTQKYAQNDLFLKKLHNLSSDAEYKLECRADALTLLVDAFGTSNLQIVKSPINHIEDVSQIIQPDESYYTVKISNVQFHSILEFCLQHHHLVTAFNPPCLGGAIFMALFESVGRYADAISDILLDRPNNLDGFTTYLNQLYRSASALTDDD